MLIKEKKKVTLVLDAYGEYKIGGRPGSDHYVDPALAERMISTGHAVPAADESTTKRTAKYIK